MGVVDRTLLLGPRAIATVFMDTQTTIAILVTALFTTLVPFAAYLVALRIISPTHASLTAMVEPIIAGVAASFLLGEQMTLSLIFGGAIILGSIALIQLSEPTEEAPAFPHE